MKTFRLIAATFLFAAIFAVSAFAQAVQTPVGKVGVINTFAFDDKAGIAKYTTAMNSLDAEFKKDFDELQALYTRIQNLEKELGGLQTQIQNASNTTGTTVPINTTQLQTTYTTKADEYGKLGREYKFKQDDAKARYERRRQVVMGPILQDIGKAMQEFAKQKGFAMILDGAKLEEAGILLAFDEKYDATKEFITFYNTRPATTAVTTTTK